MLVPHSHRKTALQPGMLQGRYFLAEQCWLLQSWTRIAMSWRLSALRGGSAGGAAAARPAPHPPGAAAGREAAGRSRKRLGR